MRASVRAWRIVLAAILGACLATAPASGQPAPSEEAAPAADTPLPKWALLLDGLARDLQAPGDAALAAARKLAASKPVDLGLSSREKADFLLSVVPVLQANAAEAEAGAVLAQRSEIYAGLEGGKDTDWALAREDYVRWLLGQGKTIEALNAQREVVEVFTAELGPTSLGLVPHLELLLTALKQDRRPQAEIATLTRRLAPLQAQETQLASQVVAMGPITRPVVPSGRVLAERVRVYYATNREPVKPNARSRDPYFSGDPGPLRYGYTEVLVPQRTEETIARTSLWGIEVSPARLKNSVVLRPRSVDTAAAFHTFVRRDAQRVGELLVYVHGYNTGFSDALKVAANLAVDLDMQGPPIVYSWPSRDALLDYWQDAEVIESAALDYAGQLEQLLADLVAKNPHTRIHVVAHSMGNRVTLAALQKLARSRTWSGPPIAQVVLASPDVEAARFPALAADAAKVTRRLTVYASTRDRAMFASRFFNANSRAGYPYTLPANAPGDKIDTSRAPKVAPELTLDLLGHDDYLHGALTDLRALLWFDQAPPARCALQRAGAYYALTGAGCALGDYTTAMILVRRLGNKLRALNLAKDQIDIAPNSAERARWTRIHDIVDKRL